MPEQKAYIELNAPIAKLKADLLKAQALVSKSVKTMSANINIGLTGAYAAAGVGAAKMGPITTAAIGGMGGAFISAGKQAEGFGKSSQKSFKELSKGINLTQAQIKEMSHFQLEKSLGLENSGKAFWQLEKIAKQSGEKITTTFRKSGKNITTSFMKLPSVFEGIGKKIGNAFGNAFASIGRKIVKVGVIAAGVAAAMSAAFIGVGVKMAMAFEEAEVFFEKTFGEMSADVRKWSKGMQKQLGVSADASRKFASTLNTMVKSMGMGKKESKDMSKRLIELTYDLSSARNVPVAEAFNKIRTAMTGMGRGMKDLGYIVDDTTAKEYAYITGLVKKGRKLSNSEKVIARYNLMLEATNEVHGDLKDTNISTTNTLRRVKNTFGDLTREIGNEFMPVFHEMLVGFNEFLLSEGPAMITMALNIAHAFSALPAAFQIIEEDFTSGLDKAKVYGEYWSKDFIGTFKATLDTVGAGAAMPFQYLNNAIINSHVYLKDFTKEYTKSIFGKGGKEVKFKHTTFEETFTQVKDALGPKQKVSLAMEKVDTDLAKKRTKAENATTAAAIAANKAKDKILDAIAKNQADRDAAKAKRIADNLAAEQKALDLAEKASKAAAAEALAEENRNRKGKMFMGRFGSMGFSYDAVKKLPSEVPAPAAPFKPLTQIEAIMAPLQSKEVRDERATEPLPLTQMEAIMAPLQSPGPSASTASKYTIESIVKELREVKETIKEVAMESLNKQMAIV